VSLAPRSLALDPAAPLPEVRVKSISLNPTVYRKRIDHVDRAAQMGDLVRVVDGDNRTLGFGLYNPKSEIAVRMVRFEEALPDEAFWDDLLSRAVSLRRVVLKLDAVADSYRVIHAESDGFPGMVVDKLGEVLAAEVYSPGMYQRATAILAKLQPMLGTQHTLIRPAPYTLSQEGWEAPGVASEGLPGRITIQEYGTRFRVQFESGHKTGFFCDQRENRKMLAGFCEGKNVLDLCCYSGGFSVQAKRLGGAAEVTGVDLDEKAIAIAKENANLNQVRVRFVHSDAFNYMRDMLSTGRQFDVVVLDPPKLIRSRAELEEGTRKHFSLNRLAMQLVAPGGLLLTCTCAGLLSGNDFTNLVCTAARQCGRVIEPATEERPEKRGARTAQILAKTGAAADHPVAAQCPETEYLQAIWMWLW
jgi:23S rRNA (cytosine1962-C5)-methyltransferase